MSQVELRKILFDRQGGRCFYCDRSMNYYRRVTASTVNDKLRCTVDHILPGKARPVVGACLQCNNERGQLPAHEYVLCWSDRLNGPFVPAA